VRCTLSLNFHNHCTYIPVLSLLISNLKNMKPSFILPDLDKVMHEPTLNMRLATFELIPAREQPFHEYLKASNHQKPLPPLADRYHMGQVNARLPRVHMNYKYCAGTATVVLSTPSILEVLTHIITCSLLVVPLFFMKQITLQEFANLKRPDLSEIEQRKSVPWPTPERTYLCIVRKINRIYV